jgi:hypothetical protein
MWDIPSTVCYFFRKVFQTLARIVASFVALGGLGGGGFTNATWKADCLTESSVQRVTISTSLFSNHRTIMLSLCQTPVVHIASGPQAWRMGCGGESSSRSVLSELSLRRRCIRFAMTTSVNTRSPTTTSSSSLIGTRNVEKYARMAFMQEYAGFGELCRSTGTER